VDPNLSGVCCGGKLLAQGLLCCNGVAYNPTTSVCCNNFVTDLRDNDDRCCVYFNSVGAKETKTYDSSKETCCSGNGLDVSGSGGVIKGSGACCGTSLSKAKTYDVNTEFCCGGKLVSKTKYNACCGSKGYDKSTQVCCGGKVYPISKGSSCCGKKSYNPSQKTCCTKTTESNAVVTKLYDGVYKCCNGEPIKTKDTVCCSDGFSSSQKTGDSCCGVPVKGYFSSKGEICCSGQITKGNACCGTIGYTTNKGKVCCGGQLVDGDSCCGSQAYDSSKNICCSGVIRSLKYGSNTKCCNDQTYDASENDCCSGSIFDPSTKICCKA